jgi:prepilin-type processing-associated H-X9-DG protein
MHEALDKAGVEHVVFESPPATIFPGAKAIKMQEITDGLAHTILVVDASDAAAVTWTKPDDWNIAVEFNAQGLFGHHPKGTNFGFADGNVLFLKETITPKRLHALTTSLGPGDKRQALGSQSRRFNPPHYVWSAATILSVHLSLPVSIFGRCLYQFSVWFSGRRVQVSVRVRMGLFPLLPGGSGRRQFLEHAFRADRQRAGRIDTVGNREVVLHTFATYVQLASIGGSTLRAPDDGPDDWADAFALACAGRLAVGSAWRPEPTDDRRFLSPFHPDNLKASFVPARAPSTKP